MEKENKAKLSNQIKTERACCEEEKGRSRRNEYNKRKVEDNTGMYRK